MGILAVVCDLTTMTDNLFPFCLGADLHQLECIQYGPSDMNMSDS